jgi:hypothetical protein
MLIQPDMMKLWTWASLSRRGSAAAAVGAGTSRCSGSRATPWICESNACRRVLGAIARVAVSLLKAFNATTRAVI